jgi:hypothetical protein
MSSEDLKSRQGLLQGPFTAGFLENTPQTCYDHMFSPETQVQARLVELANQGLSDNPC